jgi:hypothetical protein
VRITLEVSEDNEATSFPWWVILDPDQNMSCDIHILASQFAGPFFSREEAEAELKATRYNYGPRAVVYCKSGCYSRQYQQKMRDASKSWLTRLREVLNAHR